MTDDCGDMFDESECSGSSQVAFENGEAEGNVLLLNPPDDQSTSRYWNVTKPLDTDWKQNAGAAFDHTQGGDSIVYFPFWAIFRAIF